MDFDAYNANLNFVFEYVSSDDFNQYGDDDKEYAGSSVSVNTIRFIRYFLCSKMMHNVENYKSKVEKLFNRI